MIESKILMVVLLENAKNKKPIEPHLKVKNNKQSKRKRVETSTLRIVDTMTFCPFLDLSKQEENYMRGEALHMQPNLCHESSYQQNHLAKALIDLVDPEKEFGLHTAWQVVD